MNLKNNLMTKHKYNIAKINKQLPNQNKAFMSKKAIFNQQNHKQIN